MLLRGSNIFLRILIVTSLIVLMTILLIDTRHMAAQTDQSSSSDIDTYIQQAMTRTKIPGLAVVIVKGKEIVYLRGFGFASLRTRFPVTPQTLFDLASCSKSFTALAVLYLWYEGLIDLDKPVNTYLPEFRLADDDLTSQITVRQLLLQTSGIPGEIAEPVSYHRGSDAMKELVGAMAGIHLENLPGTTFEYANSNYNLLGALVEKVSGKCFEDFVQENIFSVIGMKNSTLYPEIAARRDRADGHQLFLGRVVARNTPIYRSAIPAGWIMSSAEDMGKWIIANLNNGVVDDQQVIPEELVKTMHATGTTFTSDSKETGYGMGWFTGTTDSGDKVVWHGGDTPNFVSEIILLPEKKLGIVMLANGQTCHAAHDIAIDITSLMLGTQFELPSAPWWASWKSMDNIATYTVVLSLLLILGLLPYIWWQVHVIRRLRRQTKQHVVQGKKLKIWWIVLPVTPWMIFSVIAATAYIVIHLLFGYNVFLTIGRFGYFAPPGVLVAAIAILVAIFLWAIALSLTTIFRALARESKS